jgi:hypothetical protein
VLVVNVLDIEVLNIEISDGQIIVAGALVNLMFQPRRPAKLRSSQSSVFRRTSETAKLFRGFGDY